MDRHCAGRSRESLMQSASLPNILEPLLVSAPCTSGPEPPARLFETMLLPISRVPVLKMPPPCVWNWLNAIVTLRSVAVPRLYRPPPSATVDWLPLTVTLVMAKVPPAALYMPPPFSRGCSRSTRGRWSDCRHCRLPPHDRNHATVALFPENQRSLEMDIWLVGAARDV